MTRFFPFPFSGYSPVRRSPAPLIRRSPFFWCTSLVIFSPGFPPQRTKPPLCSLIFLERCYLWISSAFQPPPYKFFFLFVCRFSWRFRPGPASRIFSFFPAPCFNSLLPLFCISGGVFPFLEETFLVFSFSQCFGFFPFFGASRERQSLFFPIIVMRQEVFFYRDSVFFLSFLFPPPVGPLLLEANSLFSP